MSEPLHPVYSITGVGRLNPVFDESEASLLGAVPLTPQGSFWRLKTIEELATEQGVKPLRSIDDLRCDFWPEEDDIDEFLAEIRRWRSGEESRDQPE